MSIYKRGSVYWYKFKFNGLVIRKSTHQGNDRLARQMEAKESTRLAQQEDARQAACLRLKCSQVLLCDECEKWFNADEALKEEEHIFCSDSCDAEWKKRHKRIPTLAEFCQERFAPWARATFEETCLNNWLWFRAGIQRLTGYDLLANSKLDEITTEKVAGFVAFEQTRLQKRSKDKKKEKRGLAVSSINSATRVLRRVLSVAVEWGVIDSAPKLSLLSGERHREHVITGDEEARYLAAAPPLLAEVAIVLADTGLRPDECHRMKWEEITWLNGRNGTLLVTHGKTKAARRVLPLTPRVRSVLEMRWKAAGQPVEGWVWPAPTQCGHIDHSSLKKQHIQAVRLSNVRPFVLYNFRHTFLTRLGASGCDAWTLARIAGHSSITISSRYVHPSEDVVLRLSRLGGHKRGHSELQATVEENSVKLPSGTDMYN